MSEDQDIKVTATPPKEIHVVGSAILGPQGPPGESSGGDGGGGGALDQGSMNSFIDANGDFWMVQNAELVDGVWNRIDTTDYAFAMQWITKGVIPGEEGIDPIGGIVFWRCIPGNNPIGPFASFGGWENVFLFTQYRDVVIGGQAIEIDGAGTFPFGRVIHAPEGTWIGQNAYADFNGRDDPTKDSLVIGVFGDEIKARLWPANEPKENIIDLLTLSKSGHLSVKPIAAPNTVWSIRTAGTEAVYSSPIVATLSGQKVAIYQSWDWFLYVVDLGTGDQLWRKAFGDQNYGRAQAADVNGDGRLEIFGASHDGAVWSLNDDGSLRWRFFNLYDREGNGTATAANATSITDSSKSWAPNSFRRGTDPTENAQLTIVSGTGAGQTRDISATTATKITVSAAFSPAPTAGSVYRIDPRYPSDKYWQHAGTLSQEGGTWYLYACGFDGQCVKLNANTGALVWKMSALENIEPFPLVMDVNGDGQVECLFNCVDGNLYCRKGSDGTAVWTCTLGEAPEGLDAFLVAADIDNDGVIEVIASGRTNRVHVVNGQTGVEEAHTNDTGADIDSRPALWPADESGQRDWLTAGDSGYAYRFRPDGTTVWRTPVAVNIGVNSSPIVFDVDGDGEPEAIVCDMSGTISFLNAQGQLRGELHTVGGVEGTPLVGDLDDDGEIEILYTTIDGYTVLARWDTNGTT